MQPSSFNQPQQATPAASAGSVPTYATQPGVSVVPQHVPAFNPAGTPVPQQAAGQPVIPQPGAFTQDRSIPPTPPATAMPQTDVVPNQPVVAGATTQVPSQKPAHTNPNSTQNALQIAEIRDGIMIMNDGSYRSILMVKSINFDLMSQQEQEAVEFSYQGFLNSLYFPVQIFIRSQKVDLQPYIDRLDKIRSEHDNMLLAMLMDDYINYIDQLGQQTNIMDKKFYIVIPFFPHVDVQKAITQSKNFLTGIAGLFNNKQQHIVVNEDDLEKAKVELRNRVQAVLSGLVQCGIQGLPLDTQELIELMYDTYNPDTATRQQLKNFSGNLDVDIVTKGAGQAIQPHMQREMN